MMTLPTVYLWEQINVLSSIKRTLGCPDITPETRNWFNNELDTALLHSSTL